MVQNSEGEKSSKASLPQYRTPHLQKQSLLAVSYDIADIA